MGPMLAACSSARPSGTWPAPPSATTSSPSPGRAHQLLVVPANVARFAEDWSLTLTRCACGCACARSRRTPCSSKAHVAERLRDLLVQVVQGMAEDTAGARRPLQGVDLTEPDSLQSLLGDPEPC